MAAIVDPLLMLVILLNFLALGSSRLAAVVRVVGIQGLLLGLLPLAMHTHAMGYRGAAVAVGATVLKGWVIPTMLGRAVASTRDRRELQPAIGFVPALIIGAVGTGAGLLFAGTLPLAEEHQGLLVVPAALSNVVTGFLLLTSRRLAVSHVLGVLVLENGVYTFGLTLLEAMPSLVEIGVLLDVFVGVFVMVILIKHIDREIASLDTARLSTLKE